MLGLHQHTTVHWLLSTTLGCQGLTRSTQDVPAHRVQQVITSRQCLVADLPAPAKAELEAAGHGPCRHEAKQNDGLAKYGWLQHDGQGYGLQELWDGHYNITTAWVSSWLQPATLAGE